MAGNQPSEFGGRPGLIQRLTDGHEPTPSERAYLLRQPDPSPRWVKGIEQAADPTTEEGVQVASSL